MSEKTQTVAEPVLPGMPATGDRGAVKPRPPELPAQVKDWVRLLKTERTINDFVEDVHVQLLEDEDLSDDYRKLLYACWDSQTVEGSLATDNVLAAIMIREKAGPSSSLAEEKLATIVKSLGVVLRRYGASRKQRRDMLEGKVDPATDGNNGDGAE